MSNVAFCHDCHDIRWDIKKLPNHQLFQAVIQFWFC